MAQGMPGSDRGSIWSTAFSPDGKTLATGLWEGTVRLWDVSGAEPREKAVFQEDFEESREASSMHVCAVAFAPDEKTLATGNWGKVVRLWDLSGASPKERGRLEGHSGPVRRVAFSPDGASLASCDDDGAVRLWDLGALKGRASLQADAQERAVLRAHSTLAGGLAFAPDGKTLLSSGLDGLLVLWDAATGREVRRWTMPGPVSYAAF